jgi:hypothetical protein
VEITPRTGRGICDIDSAKRGLLPRVMASGGGASRCCRSPAVAGDCSDGAARARCAADCALRSLLLVGSGARRSFDCNAGAEGRRLRL